MTTDRRIGSRVGGYVLEDVVGRGGMGVVFRARDRSGEVVALKLMLPELSGDPTFRRRFMDEAATMPELDHPHVVPVLEHGEADGELFIAMRFIEGRDLKTIIAEEGALPPKRALSILEQAASALDAAHESGVVHRDVKPHNMMITSEGGSEHVYLTDFGLIRPIGGGSTTGATGRVFGSIQYMAPEQIEALPDDGRGDVYSLACVAYECLTGRVPFERPNEVAVIWAHVHEDPPRVTDAVASLPGGLDDVIRRGMAKHPDDRYLTCGELVSALRDGARKARRAAVAAPLRPLVRRRARAKAERDVWSPNFFPELARVRTQSQRVKWVPIALGTALIGGMIGAGAIAQHPRGFQGAADDVASAVEGVSNEVRGLFSDEGAGDRKPTRSPKPRTNRGSGDTAPVAAGGSTGGGNAPSAPARPPAKSGPLPAPPVARVPRSNVILFHVAGKWHEGFAALYTMTSDGSKTNLLYNSKAADEDGAWSPSGTRIAFVSDGGLFVMDADGTDMTRLTPAGSVARDPSWSPDGNRIVFAYSPVPASPEWNLHVVAADGSGAGVSRPLTESQGHDLDPSWSPDGTQIVFTRSASGNRQLFVMESDGSDERALFGADVGHDTWAAAWSPGGDRLVHASSLGSGRLEVRNLNGDRLAAIGCNATCGAPAWSPDGRKVLFADQARDPGGPWNLYVARPGTAGRRLLTSNVSPDTKGDWR